jgi:hypothetical protein
LRTDGFFGGVRYAQVDIALLPAAGLRLGTGRAGGSTAGALVVTSIYVPVWWHVAFIRQVGSTGLHGRLGPQDVT